MVASITVRLPPVDRPAAFTSGPRPGTPSPGPTTYPRVTGSLDTAASLDRFRRLSARYIASPCRRARIHPKLRHTTRRDYRKLLGRGHTTASITTDTYGHLIRSELEELAGRLEQALVQRCSPTARTSRGHPRRNRWSQARRKWDSNPRDPLGSGDFQGRCLRPLGHSSDGSLLTRPWWAGLSPGQRAVRGSRVVSGVAGGGRKSRSDADRDLLGAAEGHVDGGLLLFGEVVGGLAALDLLGVGAGLGTAVDRGQHDPVPGLVEQGDGVGELAGHVGEGVVAGEADRADQARDALAVLGGLAAELVDPAMEPLDGGDVPGHGRQEVLVPAPSPQQAGVGAADPAQAQGQQDDAEGQHHGKPKRDDDQDGQVVDGQLGHGWQTSWGRGDRNDRNERTGCDCTRRTSKLRIPIMPHWPDGSGTIVPSSSRPTGRPWPCRSCRQPHPSPTSTASRASPATWPSGRCSMRAATWTPFAPGCKGSTWTRSSWTSPRSSAAASAPPGSRSARDRPEPPAPGATSAHCWARPGCPSRCGSAPLPPSSAWPRPRGGSTE